MITSGMTTWEEFIKENRYMWIYFGETIDEGGERDPANGDNDFLPVVAEEKVEENLQQRSLAT